MATTTLVQDVITAAFNGAGIVADGDVPTDAQLSTGLFTYNALLHTLENIGNDTWLRNTKALTLVAGIREYTFAAGSTYWDTAPPRRIHNAYRTVDYSTAVPLSKISKQEYFQIPNKTAPGIPVQYYYDQKHSTGTLSIWPVPAATDLPMILVMDYQALIVDQGLGDEILTPAHWTEALRYNLEVRLCLNYGRPVTQELRDFAAATLKAASDQEYEDSPTYLVPDERVFHG